MVELEAGVYSGLFEGSLEEMVGRERNDQRSGNAGDFLVNAGGSCFGERDLFHERWKARFVALNGKLKEAIVVAGDVQFLLCMGKDRVAEDIAGSCSGHERPEKDDTATGFEVIENIVEVNSHGRGGERSRKKLIRLEYIF